ncbi:exocyst subunit [Massospora cicadina]|nr:exocyst subunit [Massospora cicadina]
MNNRGRPERGEQTDPAYEGLGNGSSLNKAEASLRQVKKQWSPLLSSEFNPVSLALELLDSSSLGRDLGAFENLLNTLNTTVEEVVNDHYRQFSTTTAIFTGVQAEINRKPRLDPLTLKESSAQVQAMRQDLLRCKDILTTQRSDLNVLWSKAKQYKEMLHILDLLDEIKVVPDRLESLFRDKYYLTGIRLLISTLKQLDTPALAPIKATTEIRRTLTKVKNTLHEALIEEIHNHVYLKVHLDEEFDNLSGFSSMDKFQEMVAKYLSNDFDDQHLPVTLVRSPTASPGEQLKWVELEEDLTADPEVDTLNFLRIVVISLRLIGKLPEALAMIKARAPVELYQLVDKTINEVDALREKSDPLQLKPGLKADAAVGEGGPPTLQPLGPHSQETLDSLVGRLYQKFILVLGHHHFIGLLVQTLHQSSRGAASPFPEEAFAVPNPTNLNRRVSWLKLTKESQAPSYTVKEVWAAIQSEIRSILFDYITDPQLQTMGVTDTVTSINDSMRGKDVRDLRKPIYKFHGDDLATRRPLCGASELSEKFQAYEQVRARVSGSAGSDAAKRLFTPHGSHLPILEGGSPARRPPASGSALTINLASIAVDKYSLASNLSTEHRLLTAPDIYNIAVLFPHTLNFLKRAQLFLNDRDLEPLGTESFLHDFFTSSFLPQMELKAQQHLKLATAGPQAFQISTQLVSGHGRPLLNCVGELGSLVRNLCATLQSLPFQREEYIRIIESILRAFLEKCEGCFKGITNGQMAEESRAVVSSLWAQSPELRSLFDAHPYMRRPSSLNPRAAPVNVGSQCQYGSYFATEDNYATFGQLNEREMEIEIQLKQKRSLHTSELLFDSKKLSLLATLSHSLKWFAAQVNLMIGTSQSCSSSQTDVFDPFSSELAQVPRGSSILSKVEMTSHFDSLLGKFNRLADLCLITLRIELRCHTMYYLDLAVREGNYYLPPTAPLSPDAYVVALNSDLAICEESLHDHLTPEDLRFVFDMLASFMARVLISADNVRNLGRMSRRGLTKMQLNLAALQQSLTSLGFFEDVGLAHAHAFYALYDLDLETFAERARNQGLLFAHAEYKSLLDLTLETLHYETTSGASEKADPTPDPARSGSGRANREKVNDLIVQAYHNQLMALREFTARYDE